MKITETLNFTKTPYGGLEISGIGENRMQYMGYSKKEAINKYLTDCKPAGVLSTSTWGGLVILDFEYGIDDYCLCGFNFGNGNENLRWRKIYTNLNGNQFIKINGQRYNFSDFMRI